MTRLVSLFSLISALTLAACASPTPCDDPDGCPPTSPDAGGARCGDNVCQSTETAQSCPADCHSVTPMCGNNLCEAGESQATCPADCGTPETCGNGVCASTETVQSCPADCAATLVVDNTSTYTLVYFYAWACGTSNTFTNLFAQPLLPNYHVTFTGVTPGCWNIQADTASHAQTAQDLNLTFTAGKTFTWTIHN